MEVLHIISRKKAAELGMMFYFTGEPCKWGHIAKRYLGGDCYECAREREQRRKTEKKERHFEHVAQNLADLGIDREIISREAARELGLKMYFDGVPCKHGHMGDRRVCNGRCVECQRISLAKWREDHRQHTRDYSSKYREEHREQVLEASRKWSENNRKYASEYEKKRRARKGDYIRKRRREQSRERYKEDPDYRCYIRIRGFLYRTLKSAKEGKDGRTSDLLGYGHKEFLLAMEEKMHSDMGWHNYGKCWHIDHMCPINRYKKSGVTDPAIVNSLDNLIPMYAHHNIEKSDKTLEEWLSEKGEDSEEYRLYGHYLNKE